MGLDCVPMLGGNRPDQDGVAYAKASQHPVETNLLFDLPRNQESKIIAKSPNMPVLASMRQKPPLPHKKVI